VKEKRVKELIQDINTKFKSKKEFSPSLIQLLKDLRAEFIQLEEPSIVKSIRLVYEFIEENDSFLIDAWESDGVMTSFEYYMGLLSKYDNKYNKEEIKSLNDYLKAILAGEEAEFVRTEDEES
jgi:hypothetical protein